MSHCGWAPALGSDPEAFFWQQTEKEEQADRVPAPADQEVHAGWLGRKPFHEPGWSRAYRPDRSSARRAVQSLREPPTLQVEDLTFEATQAHSNDRCPSYTDGSGRCEQTPEFGLAGAGAWQPERNEEQEPSPGSRLCWLTTSGPPTVQEEQGLFLLPGCPGGPKPRGVRNCTAWFWIS